MISCAIQSADHYVYPYPYYPPVIYSPVVYAPPAQPAYSPVPRAGGQSCYAGPLCLSDGAAPRAIVRPAADNVASSGAEILRRGYAYNDGVNFTAERWPPWRQGMEYDAGLFFICYQSDPRTGFVRMFGPCRSWIC